MRIAIDVRRLRDFGVGTYIRNLLNALAVEDQRNQYFLIVHPEDAGQLAHLPASFQPVLYSRKDTDRLEHLMLPLFLRRIAPDLVHFPLNRIPLLLRRPYVVTIHDMGVLIYPESSGAWRSLRKFRFRQGILRAVQVIAVSAATRRDIHNLIGIPEKRIQLVYNAPAPEFFDRDRSSHNGEDLDREKLDADARLERERIFERYQIRHPFLLYAGNIRPQKNIPRLVEAFAVARAELEHHPVYKDLRLIIIGDEISKYPAVRRAVMQSRVEQCVRFLGFVPFDTLRVFYELATVFVFPSLYEGFGLPPLEAMASGTPVITSEVSALPEAAGDAALLVNPENVFDIARAIKEVLLDEGLRAKLIAKGRTHAATFSWERTAREVIGIYERVGHSNISKTEAR